MLRIFRTNSRCLTAEYSLKQNGRSWGVKFLSNGKKFNLYFYFHKIFLTLYFPHKNLWTAMLPLTKIFGWKFRKLSYQMEWLFFLQTSKLAISLVDQETYMMAQENNEMEMEILCQWNENSSSNRLERERWSSFKGRQFVLENFRLIRAYHLHFNR